MEKLLKKLNMGRFKRKLIAKLASMHFYGNPSAKLKVIGVTGTNGKTTTATLLYQVATALGYKAGLIGTIENIIVEEKRATINTTPGPIPLNKLFLEMVEKGCEYVFMEVSSHAMDQSRVAGINFTGGIFTNFSQDHLDYHKNMEDYFSAKKKFFKMLPADAFALSNIDDEKGREITKDTKAKTYFYGFNESKDFHGEVLKLDFSGLELNFNNQIVHSRLLGKFNAYNLLAVWSTCKLLGFDMGKVNKILENVEPPAGRFVHFMSPKGVLGIVDYAHSPDSVAKILLTTKELNKSGRIIFISGCGGEKDPLKRPIMGRIGAEYSDLAIFTSDNPRYEDLQKILKEMQADLTPELSKKVLVIPDRHEAIQKAGELVRTGDVVLCVGKGIDNYEEIRGKKHYFNDTEELKKAFG